MSKPGKRVLVAEDEFLIRVVVVETLEENGFVVLEAGCGEEALRLIRDVDDLDLLITNINMPGATGLEVADAARLRHPEIPVLFVSANPELMAGWSRPSDKHHHLTKPFDLLDLSRMAASLTA
jgi:CheY-like chemotaxis protein